MKICFLTSTYPRNATDGIGSFVKSLAQNLVALGHKVSVVAPHDPAVAPMDHGGVQVYRFRYPPWNDRYLAGHGRAMVADVHLTHAAPWLMPGFVASGVIKALTLHCRERFDLFHGHWLLPGGFMATLAAKLAFRPLLLSLHGSDVYFARKNRFYGAFARFALRCSTFTVACSSNLHAGALALGAAPERTLVIPYGVETARFAGGQGDRLRARLGLPQDVPIIGAIGRLSHKKGFNHLLAALPQVLAAVPDAYCVIGGAGDLYADLEAQIRRLGLQGRAILAGPISWEDTPAFYAMCDVVAVPSVVDPYGNVDGLPNVLLEAMASGRAVVASRVAGIPDVVTDGAQGLLVPPGDEAALAQALIRLLGDAHLRAQLGAAAQQLMTTAFTWQEIARRYEALYEEALHAGKRDRR